jgi:hypothetical protein
MRKHLKRIVLLATTAVVIGLASSAYAYFSSAGAGTGDAAVGTASDIVLSSDGVTDLQPGGADMPVTVRVYNPGGGNELVAYITGTFADNGGCLGSWFVVDPIDFNTVVGPDDTVVTETNIRMLDPGVLQDVCMNRTMTINWRAFRSGPGGPD